MFVKKENGATREKWAVRGSELHCLPLHCRDSVAFLRFPHLQTCLAFGLLAFHCAPSRCQAVVINAGIEMQFIQHLMRTHGAPSTGHAIVTRGNLQSRGRGRAVKRRISPASEELKILSWLSCSPVPFQSFISKIMTHNLSLSVPPLQ